MPQVNDFPLAELLRELAVQTKSGAVRLELERARAVVYVEAGKPVFAASNVKELRLGEYLAKRELVSRDLLSRVNHLPDAGLAKELIRQNLLDENSLNQISAALVIDVLRVLLLWTRGSWEFDQRTRLADSLRVQIENPSLLRMAARKMDPKFIAGRFADRDEMISRKESEIGNDFLPDEVVLLSRLDQPTPLGDLILMSGQREEQALQSIYGLAIAGFVERTSWPASLQSTPAVEPKPFKPTPVEVTPPTETDEQQLERFFVQVETAETHYQVLDTMPAAAVDEIKRSYYGLARRYHPDRFHSNLELHRRIESAFARITQAYETLTDPSSRTKYDSRLAAQQKVKSIADTAPKSQQQTAPDGSTPLPTASEQSAEISFREGYAALQMGQLRRALTSLAAAANSAPNEPRYRAYYGKVLAASSKTQKMAETEFLAAVRLEPNNASYHLMLAQLYYDLTFHKRARAEAIRALELEPKLVDAEVLLRRLENK